MEWLEFRTQRELLSFIGKNENDRHLIQRMIARGDVHVKDGMYYLYDEYQKDESTRLRERVRELEGKILEKSEWEEKYQELYGKYMRLEQELSKWRDGGDIGSNGVDEEAEVQWHYYEELNAKKKEMIERILMDNYLEKKKRGFIQNEDDFWTEMNSKYGFSRRDD